MCFSSSMPPPLTTHAGGVHVLLRRLARFRHFQVPEGDPRTRVLRMSNPFPTNYLYRTSPSPWTFQGYALISLYACASSLTKRAVAREQVPGRQRFSHATRLSWLAGGHREHGGAESQRRLLELAVVCAGACSATPREAAPATVACESATQRDCHEGDRWQRSTYHSRQRREPRAERADHDHSHRWLAAAPEQIRAAGTDGFREQAEWSARMGCAPTRDGHRI